MLQLVLLIENILLGNLNALVIIKKILAVLRHERVLLILVEILLRLRLINLGLHVLVLFKNIWNILNRFKYICNLIFRKNFLLNLLNWLNILILIILNWNYSALSLSKNIFNRVIY